MIAHGAVGSESKDLGIAAAYLAVDGSIKRESASLQLKEDVQCVVAQLVEQRLGFFQVGGVEALSEPAADLGEHCAGFIAPASICE